MDAGHSSVDTSPDAHPNNDSRNTLSPDIIEKLSHPIEEIRLRALQSMQTKLQCGILTVSTISKHKELLTRLINWFRFPNAPRQPDVLEILVAVASTVEGAVSLKDIDALKELELASAGVFVPYKPVLNTIHNLITQNSAVEVQQQHAANEILDRAEDGSDRKSDDVETATSRLFAPEYYCQIAEPEEDYSSHQVFTATHLPFVPLSNVDRAALQWACDSLTNSRNNPMLAINSLNFYIDTVLEDFPAEIFMHRTQTIRAIYTCCLSKHPDVSALACEALLHTVLKVWVRIQTLLRRDHMPLNYRKALNKVRKWYQHVPGTFDESAARRTALASQNAFVNRNAPGNVDDVSSSDSDLLSIAENVGADAGNSPPRNVSPVAAFNANIADQNADEDVAMVDAENSNSSALVAVNTPKQDENPGDLTADIESPIQIVALLKNQLSIPFFFLSCIEAALEILSVDKLVFNQRGRACQLLLAATDSFIRIASPLIWNRETYLERECVRSLNRIFQQFFDVVEKLWQLEIIAEPSFLYRDPDADAAAGEVMNAASGVNSRMSKIVFVSVLAALSRLMLHIVPPALLASLPGELKEVLGRVANCACFHEVQPALSATLVEHIKALGIDIMPHEPAFGDLPLAANDLIYQSKCFRRLCDDLREAANHTEALTALEMIQVLTVLWDRNTAYSTLIVQPALRTSNAATNVAANTDLRNSRSNWTFAFNRFFIVAPHTLLDSQLLLRALETLKKMLTMLPRPISAARDSGAGAILETLFFGPKTCLFDIYKVVAERIEFEHDGRMTFVELLTLRQIQRTIFSILGEVCSVFSDISPSHIVTLLEIYAHYLNQPSHKFLSTLGMLVMALEALARTLHTRHEGAGNIGWRTIAYSTGKLLASCLIKLTNDFAVGRADQATSFMGRRLMLNSSLALVCLAQTLMPMDRLTPWPTEWQLLPPSTSPLCVVVGGIGIAAVPAAESIGIISRGFAYLEHYLFHREAEVRALGFALAMQLASTVPGRDMLLKSFHRSTWHEHVGSPMPVGGICSIALDALVDDDDAGGGEVGRRRSGGEESSSGGESDLTRCFAAKLLTTLNGFGSISERDLYGAQRERELAQDLTAKPQNFIEFLQSGNFFRAARNILCAFGGITLHGPNDMLTNSDDQNARTTKKPSPTVASSTENNQRQPIFISRNLVSSVCRLLHNILIDHGKAAVQMIYAERIQDALLLACLLPFAEALETTWLEEGDEARDEQIDMLAESIAVLRVLAWTDKKFCHDMAESENICRTLLAAFNVQIEMMGEIRNTNLITQICHIFYMCLQNNLTAFSRQFVHLLRPVWADFADTVIAILRYSPNTSTAGNMDTVLMEIVFAMLHSQYGASFQDLLELPYLKIDMLQDEWVGSVAPSNVLDVLGLKLLSEQRAARHSMRVGASSSTTARHLMQLIGVSAKARRFIVQAGEVEATIAAIRSLHADFKLNYRGPQRVLSCSGRYADLSSLEMSAMLQWCRLLLQMLYDNVEAKRIASRCGLPALIIRLWPTLMQPSALTPQVGGKTKKRPAFAGENVLNALHTVVLQILVTFTAGCNEAGEAMVQPLFADKPSSPCLLQLILRDLLQQLSRSVRRNLSLLGILFGLVCQCSFYPHCRVLIRLQPALLRAISLARPATATTLHVTTTSSYTRKNSADSGHGGDDFDDLCKVVPKKAVPVTQQNEDLIFETTVRNLTLDLMTCLSYSEDGQFFIYAALTPTPMVPTTPPQPVNVSAINMLYEIARQPAEFGVKAHGSAMLVLRNFCFNKALRGRIAAIPGIMPFLMKFLFGSPAVGFDARAHLLATSILIELCKKRRKLHKQFEKMEIDLDTIIRFTEDEQHLILLHKLRKVLQQQPRGGLRRRRIKRGPISVPHDEDYIENADEEENENVENYYLAASPPPEESVF